MAGKTKNVEAEVYLGKANKIYGPFSSAEIDQMATSGKLSNFVWLWDHENEEWKPIELPPPAPIKTQKATNKQKEWVADSALCYDNFNTVSGTLEAINETGCVLMSKHSGASPKFAVRSNVSINILDPEKTGAKKSFAKIIDIVRDQDQWAYRLRWVSGR